MTTDAELDFLNRHPGGFDREFFEGYLPTLIDQWKVWATADDDYIVLLETAAGRCVQVAYARAALTWAIFFTPDQRVEILPYKQIVRIEVLARPVDVPRPAVGFSVKRV